MQQEGNIQLSFFGKMSQDPSQVQEGMTLESYLNNSAESQKREFAFLDLRSGARQGRFWQTDIVLVGEYYRQNILEYPKYAEECSLLCVLEGGGIPEKFYLSPKACKGILRRCEDRGRPLPQSLKQILINQSHSKLDAEKVGGGKGALIQEDKSATLSCSNTQVLIDAYRETMNHGYIKDMKSAPLRAKGAGCGMGSASLVAKQQKRVRRLTPLECCRLQGFPDWWCDGVEGSDTAQYKMWGNGVALPCVLYIMEGIARVGKEIGLD